MVNLNLARLKVVLIALTWSLTASSHAQEKVVAEPVLSLKVSADRLDGLYQLGETATFTIELTLGDKPVTEGSVVCVLSKDGVQPRPPQTVMVKEGKANLAGKLDEAGFLLIRASSGQASALAGVGFAPSDIKPSLPVPDDFDEFWGAQKAELAKVPARATLKSFQTNVKNVDVFDVQVDCLGKPVSGYFGRPQNAKEKSLPAILFVHGAGVRGSNAGSASWALLEGGMLTLDINAHGIPNGQPAEFYAELNAGELRDYRSIGRQDREQCYFKGMFLRLVRAIDFLTSQPEWDGKTVIVYGSSQGGFQAFAAAGLDPRVTYFCAGVPAGCDHTGSAVNRINGWPKIVPNLADGKPDPVVQQTARYFDCVNFATRAKCQGAAVTVGFIDTTCPPTSVYAAYNALTIPKAIHADVAAGHTNTPAASQFMREAALKHVRDQK